MEQTAYERVMKQFFSYISAISDQAEIFKSYPIRVRMQEKIAYYEVGASNISENREIVIHQNDTLKESANATAFEKLYLRPGDIILPYRSKQLHLGLYIESSHPLIPNPSLIVIRSGSVEFGKYFMTCLHQPFIKSYIESSMIDKERKNAILDISKFQSLIIPAAMGETIYSLHSIEKYSHYAKRVSVIHRQLDHLTTLLSAEAITGEYQSLEKTFFEYMDEHLRRVEGIVSSMEVSTIRSPAIDMLRSDFTKYCTDTGGLHS